LNKSVQLASPGKNGWTLKEAYSAPSRINVVFDSAGTVGGEVVFRTQGSIQPAQLHLLRSGNVAAESATEPAACDASNMVVENRQARSNDGTVVDYYLVRPRNIKPGSSTQTLMTGYSAFGITFEPGYLDAIVGGKGTKLWFERGGAPVLPAIRGGGDVAQHGIRLPCANCGRTRTATSLR
jgi:prolyl oligopeptidase